MSEAAETTVAAVVAAQPVEKPRITVVTNENFEEYANERLPAKPTPEETGAAELAEIEAKKAKEEDIDHPDKEKKSKLNERFSELTAKRKAAEEDAAKAKEEAKVAKDAAAAAEKRANELQAKYEPPKSDEIGPKPDLTNYAGDTVKYSTDLEEWTANKVRIEDKKEAFAKKAEADAAAASKAFMDRQAAYIKANPEYEAKISASEVTVFEEVQQAIVESEVGPQILLHLAENPDFATDLGKMTVGRALRELGKLEAKLGGEVKEPTKTTVAEISKAPAPITPLKGASAPVGVPRDSNGQFTGTYEQWKALRIAGKIK